MKCRKRFTPSRRRLPCWGCSSTCMRSGGCSLIALGCGVWAKSGSLGAVGESGERGDVRAERERVRRSGVAVVLLAGIACLQMSAQGGAHRAWALAAHGVWCARPPRSAQARATCCGQGSSRCAAGCAKEALRRSDIEISVY